MSAVDEKNIEIVKFFIGKRGEYQFKR
ncbi:hypothetical protein [Chryseobacterium balustinum]